MGALISFGLIGVVALGGAMAKGKKKTRRPALSAVSNTTAKVKTTPKIKSKPKITRVPQTSKQWQALGLSPKRAKIVDGRYVQTLDNGDKVTLTLVPHLQKQLERLYQRNKVPHGGLVLLEPSTGKVLAMVSHNRKDQPEISRFARRAYAPSASVFKVITAAALLEEKKITSKDKVCYHGGRSSLTKRNIEGHPKYDRACNTLSGAVAWSINSIMAKLTYKKLNRQTLNKWATRFGYNHTIPFEVKVDVSHATMPKDKHELSRAAAGFWHTFLSPLHGAMIGASIINDGVMMRPSMVASYADSKGDVLYEFKPKQWRRVVSRKNAKILRAMMDRTTSVGTARKYFRFRKEFPHKDILTGGKTGTLSRKKPSYLGYTWFVGYGQVKDDRSVQVAVGAIVANKPLWHIKGPYAASEGIRLGIQHLLKSKKSS